MGPNPSVSMFHIIATIIILSLGIVSLSWHISAPTTEGLRSSNTDNVVIGASVAGGIVILILILAGGVLCLACMVIRKKKIYRKYVLPYRTYMYSK